MKNRLLKKLTKKEPELVPMSLRIPEAIKKDIEVTARENQLSSNALALAILDEFFNGSSTKYENKIVTFLEMFLNETKQEISNLTEENLQHDEEFKDIYKSLLNRNHELTELIGELK